MQQPTRDLQALLDAGIPRDALYLRDGELAPDYERRTGLCFWFRPRSPEERIFQALGERLNQVQRDERRAAWEAAFGTEQAAAMWQRYEELRKAPRPAGTRRPPWNAGFRSRSWAGSNSMQRQMN